MLRFDLVTLFPEMVELISQYGITSRAIAKGHATLHAWNPRDYTNGYGVDDKPFGGGPGMVMCCEPLLEAIAEAKSHNVGAKVVYLSPQGRKLDQNVVKTMTTRTGMILVAGRYQGIDQRLIDQQIDEQWSIGDYIISGGELAALVLIDAVLRMLPGVLGNQDSASYDSFFDGLLGCPQFTRPENVNGQKVPEVLLSGDHKEIERWRMQQALGRTWLLRPDLLESQSLNETQQQLLEEFQNTHYDVRAITAKS